MDHRDLFITRVNPGRNYTKIQAEGEYSYIPSSPHAIKTLMVDFKQLSLFPGDIYTIVDLGSGIGITAVLLASAFQAATGRYASILGIEKNITPSQLKIAVCPVIKADLLTVKSFDFKYNKQLKNEVRIYYCFNIFSDPDLMLKALKLWMSLMKKEDILYYWKTSYFKPEGEAFINDKFKYIDTQVYKFVKE